MCKINSEIKKWDEINVGSDMTEENTSELGKYQYKLCKKKWRDNKRLKQISCSWVEQGTVSDSPTYNVTMVPKGVVMQWKKINFWRNSQMFS